MSEIIGVTSDSRMRQLKQQLLVVDKIAVAGDKLFFEQAWNAELAADVRWLHHHGLIFPVNAFEECEERLALIGDDGAIPATPFQLLARLGTTTGEGWESRIFDATRDLVCRIERDALERQGMHAVSLLPPSNLIMDVNKCLGSTVAVVLGFLPIPDETTALQDILTFRDDPDAKRKRQLLQRWTHNLATKDIVSEKEVAQEIEWLLGDYEAHMKLHKMKVNRGALETVIVTVAEIAEDLAKFKWGKLAKGLFSVSHRKIELLEAEMKAPGRELAYISKVRERFDLNG